MARSEAIARDRRLLERLGRIRARVGDTLDRKEADRDYPAAFRDAGIDVDGSSPMDAGSLIAARPSARELTAALGGWIFERQNLTPPDHDGARRLLAVAKAADPDPLRCRLREVVVVGEKDALQQLADSVDPMDLPVETVQRLAEAVRRLEHDPDRAVKLLRPLQVRQPGDFWLNWDLGATLGDKGADGALEGLPFLVADVAIRPDSAFARTILGKKLGELGRVDEAVAHLREAMRLEPNSAQQRYVLADCLIEWGAGDRAVVEFAEALRHSQAPSNTVPQELIAKLERSGHTETMNRELQLAVRRAPANAAAHFVLGRAMESQGRLDEAIAEYRESMRLRPEAYVTYMLGIALDRKSAFHEAVAAEREAVKLDGDRLGEAIFVLATMLRRLGHYDEAAETLRRAAELSRREGRPIKVQQAESDIRLVEQRKGLAHRLPGLRSGSDRPKDAADMYELLFFFHDRRLWADGARFCEAAFRANPKLADDPKLPNRYNAACLAALAGCGEAGEAPAADAAEKTRLRGLALTWLRASLESRRVRLKDAPAARRAAVLGRFNEWLTDADLACVRMPLALEKLPVSERAEWRALWAEFEKLRAKAKAP